VKLQPPQSTTGRPEGHQPRKRKVNKHQATIDVRSRKPSTMDERIIHLDRAGVQEQLKLFTAKWESTAVASVNSNQDLQRPRTPPRTASPRRVRFADDRTDGQYRRYDSPNRFTCGFSSRGCFRYPRRGARGRGMFSHSTHNPRSVIRPQPFMVASRIKLQ